MDRDTEICFACLEEILEETEVVYLNTIHDEENGLTYGDCLEFCANITLDKHFNNLVCNKCSLELEISYTFLKKVMRSQNILREEAEQNSNSLEGNDDDEEQPTPHDVVENNISDIKKENESISEYNEENDEWIAEEVNEQEDSPTTGDQEILNLIITENDTEEQADKLNDNEVVGTELNDDLIEEIPYEEIEVYTNSPEMETTLSDSSCEPRRRRLGKFNCDYCGKLFPNYSRMTAHRRCHEKTRTTFKCVECGRMYATDQALSVHIRTAHSKEGFTCPVCNKNFVIERSLEIHMRYHTRNFPYDCKDCGKNFAQKGHLNTHQNVKHNGLRFICVYPNCNKLFTSSASLRDHEFSHNMKPFECNICKGGYSSKSKLKTHIRQVHNMELTLEELEPMRRFFVRRSTPNAVMGVAVESD